MKYRTRLVEERLVELVRYFPVVCVLGARQSGKSTLVTHVLGERYDTVVFDPVEDIGGARRDPDLFLQNRPGPLFLDEIQYAPELLGALKRRADRVGQPGQYVLSGSQRLAVVKGMSESLAGRIAFLDLFPLCGRETRGTPRKDFLRDWTGAPGVEPTDVAECPETGWHETIWRGGYPALLDVPGHLIPSYFDGYVRTYIERDVRRVANIGDLQAFGAFSRLLAGLSGTEVNPSQMGRELGIDRRTANAWRSVMAASYQWIEVPAYSRNAVRRVAGKAKGYVTDSGLMCHQQRIGEPSALSGHPLLGNAVETWAVNEVVRAMQAWPAKPGLYHFRTGGGAEIDLLLELNGTLFPIETKHTSKPSGRDTLAWRSLRETFPAERIAKGLLICAADRPQWVSAEVLAVPWWSL